MSCTATALPASSAPTKPLADEPGHVVARARVHQRRARDPDGVAASVALRNEQAGHLRVVDRLLARDLAAHEVELAFGVTEERRRVHEDPLAAVFSGADGDHLAALYPPTLTRPDIAFLVQQQAGVHARLPRHLPLPAHLHVGRQVGAGEEVLREHSVGGRGRKLRVRRGLELGFGEVRGLDLHCSKLMSARTIGPLSFEWPLRPSQL